MLLLMYTILTCCCGASAEDKIVSRKRRYLAFPEGSTFVATMQNTKGLMWDVPTYGRPPWNTIMEFDLVFKVPNMSMFFHPHKNSMRRRDRRQVYGQVEDLFDVLGANGRSCVLRALCEAKHLLKPGRSLVEDVFYVMFTFPSEEDKHSSDIEEYDLAAKQEECEPWSAACPYSLLQLILT